MMGHLNSFSASEGGNLNKIFQKFKCPGVPWGMLKLRFDWYITPDDFTRQRETPWALKG